ncbi:MAG: helix-turn-helix transcriptional regulator [Thermoflexales bacterium]
MQRLQFAELAAEAEHMDGPVSFRPRHAPLSVREQEVLALVRAGLSNREIAGRIYVATGTVKRHLHNILSKLNARNRAEAVSVFEMRDG